jgi:hypothetical protein
VGLGTWQVLDVHGCEEGSRHEIVRAAFEAGANLFDPSAMYGEAERVLGDALSKHGRTGRPSPRRSGLRTIGRRSARLNVLLATSAIASNFARSTTSSASRDISMRSIASKTKVGPDLSARHITRGRHSRIL